MNKKHNRFGGDHRGGDFAHRDSNRPAFHGNNRGGRDGGRDVEMFQTVCASCSKNCEVPFRPNGKKPVYCKDCFAANGGPSSDSRGSNDRFAPRRDSSAPSAYKPEYRKEAPSSGMSELVKQIESMNMKLEKLIQSLSNKAEIIKEKAVAIVEAPKAAAKKKVAKKAAPKKKK